MIFITVLNLANDNNHRKYILKWLKLQASNKITEPREMFKSEDQLKLVIKPDNIRFVAELICLLVAFPDG